MHELTAKRKWYTISRNGVWIDFVAAAVCSCIIWTLVHAIITESML